MKVYLVDGTYELFRHFYALPSHRNARGEEVAAARGVLRSILGMLEESVTHIGVATDHVIESFRNDLYDGYKTGEGIDPALRAQFEPLEDAVRALGVTVWPMVEFEADDALAAAAAVADADERVEQVIICTPDKDLAQCVRGSRVVQLDRRQRAMRDEAAVERRFGVPPTSIADLLALTGDSADGFPGIAGWGAKSAATVLARYAHIEDIPEDGDAWDVPVRRARALAATLHGLRDEALLYRTLARLRLDVPVGAVDDWQWRGPTAELEDVCARLDAVDVVQRVDALRAGIR